MKPAGAQRTPNRVKRPYLKRHAQPPIPTRAAKVPAGPDWIHEIKHDGYRLIVQKTDRQRVRCSRATATIGPTVIR
jgi:ATP-dependent DNA ligase